jgi:hypothetical protein
MAIHEHLPRVLKPDLELVGRSAPYGEGYGTVGDFYFKLYKSQIPVIERALATAALMLRTDRSRGYCPEMICADFLAGANLENDNADVLLLALDRLFKLLPDLEREQFFSNLQKAS